MPPANCSAALMVREAGPVPTFIGPSSSQIKEASPDSDHAVSLLAMIK